MKRPKKVTVKFFLNEHLKEIEREDGNYYPLYVQITYNRKNTQIKCAYGGFYKSMEQLEDQYAPLLRFEEEIFKKTVYYELGQQGEEFQLRGIGKKYDAYCASIPALFDRYLKVRLKNTLQKAQPLRFLDVLQTEKRDIPFSLLLEASYRLFDNLKAIISDEFREEMEIYELYQALLGDQIREENFRFPVVIDWLAGDHSQEVAQQIRSRYPDKSDKIEKSIIILQKIISTKLGLAT